jgi:hypothetical protein
MIIMFEQSCESYKSLYKVCKTAKNHALSLQLDVNQDLTTQIADLNPIEANARLDASHDLTTQLADLYSNEANKIPFDEQMKIYLEEDVTIFEVSLDNLQAFLCADPNVIEPDSCTQRGSDSCEKQMSFKGKREYRAWIGSMGLHIS